jgi:hypothetical protein
LSGVTINYQATTANSPIELDGSTSLYNAPMNVHIFPNTTTYAFIKTNGASTRLMTYGDIKFEAAGTYKITSGSFSIATHTGSILSYGGVIDWTNAPNMFDTTAVYVDGVVRGVKKPGVRSFPLPAGGGTFNFTSAQSTDYIISLQVNTTNYFWKGLLAVCQDSFGGNAANILVTERTGGASYGAWGAPTFAWTGTGITVTNANFPAAGTVDFGFSDRGQNY